MNPSSYPKVGIRPTIDGRLGGVRESLEERTMQQARAVADLIARELRYPDGSPVQCMIADRCIYWSSSAIESASGKSFSHPLVQDGILHLINSGPAALDGTGEQEIDGVPAMKPFWEITDPEGADFRACPNYGPLYGKA